jgi:hypothetical protein
MDTLTLFIYIRATYFVLILYLAHTLEAHKVQNHTSVRVDVAKAPSFVPIFFSLPRRRIRRYAANPLTGVYWCMFLRQWRVEQIGALKRLISQEVASRTSTSST